LVGGGLLCSILLGLFFLSLQQPKGNLFNVITGTAQYNYYRAPDGKLELFPKDFQYHPKLGVKLEPVTPQVMQEAQAKGLLENISHESTAEASSSSSGRNVASASAAKAGASLGNGDIDPTKPWQGSGVKVKKGQTVSVDATGHVTWAHNADGNDTVGPE